MTKVIIGMSFLTWLAHHKIDSLYITVSINFVKHKYKSKTKTLLCCSTNDKCYFLNN